MIKMVQMHYLNISRLSLQVKCTIKGFMAEIFVFQVCGVLLVSDDAVYAA